jgi:hypothetical protein
LHLQRLVHSWKHMWWQFKKDISIESNQQELNFLKRYLVIIQISQLVGGMTWQHHSMEVRDNILNIAYKARRLWELQSKTLRTRNRQSHQRTTGCQVVIWGRIRQFNGNRKYKNIWTLKDNVKNFMFVFHNLDNTTYGS